MVKVAATPIQKLMAFVVDTLIVLLSINVATLVFPLGLQLPSDAQAFSAMLEQNPQMAYLIMAYLFGMMVVALAYFTIFEHRLKSTPGKRLLSIELEKKPNVGQALLRNLDWVFLMYPSPIILLLVLIDALSQFSNQKRQRLLEKWSKTRVIQKV
jgi:hypothetical protein